MAQRIAHYLEHQGLLERDVAGAWLTSSAGGKEDEAAIHHLLGSSIFVSWFELFSLPVEVCIFDGSPRFS